MFDQTSAAAPAAGRFGIGSCLSTSFSVYGRNFIGFSVLGLLLSLPDLLLSYYALNHGNEIGGWAQAVSGILSMVIAALISAAVVYGSFQDLRGARASFGDCISRGLSSAFPVVIASILGSLAIGLAAFVPALIGMQIIGNTGILLAFPGVIVYLIIWVYVPAIVVEGKGIIASFGRSAWLTSGRRWRILGLMLILVVLGAVVGGAIGLIIGIGASAGTGGAIFAILLAQYISQALFSVFGAVATAVGYYQLRAEKEGVDINDIAKVFD